MPDARCPRDPRAPAAQQRPQQRPQCTTAHIVITISVRRPSHTITASCFFAPGIASQSRATAATRSRAPQRPCGPLLRPSAQPLQTPGTRLRACPAPPAACPGRTASARAGAVSGRGGRGSVGRARRRAATLTEPVVLSTCRSMTAMLEHMKARPTAASTIAISPRRLAPAPRRRVSVSSQSLLGWVPRSAAANACRVPDSGSAHTQDQKTQAVPHLFLHRLSTACRPSPLLPRRSSGIETDGRGP